MSDKKTTTCEPTASDVLGVVMPRLADILMTDGQEIHMYCLSGSGCGYCVDITGDCCIRGHDDSSLSAALSKAIKLYDAWEALSVTAGA